MVSFVHMELFAQVQCTCMAVSQRIVCVLKLKSEFVPYNPHHTRLLGGSTCNCVVICLFVRVIKLYTID